MKTKPEGSLTPKQERFIDALLNFGSARLAADEIGISHVTAWRWQQLPEFKKRYRAARLALVERGIAVAQQTSEAVSRILFQIASDEEQPVFARLSACAQLRDHALKGTEMLNLDTRLSEIEERLHEAEERSARPALRSVS